jgi:ABC-type transporter Mla subunit MlaD
LIENHLEKTLENQGLINEQLAKDDPFREQINARIEELRVQLKKDMSARVKRSEVNLSEALEEVASSSSNSERAIKQVASIVKNQGNSANSLQELKGSLREVQKKLDDLYLIEQARVSQEISFQRSNDVDFEPGGGLD